MPVTSKTWSFGSNVEGWAQVSPSLPTAALAWLSSDGDPANGCLQATRDHDIGDGIQKYRSPAGETYEDWGVPPTAEVLTLRLTLRAKTADGTTTQTISARVLDGSLSSVTSVDGDLLTAQNLPAPSSWTTLTGNLRNVDFLAQESTESVRLEIEINAVEAGIETSDFRFDTITLEITYDDGGSSVAIPIQNLNGLIFKKGFAYLSRPGGTSDAVAHPALQEISITDSSAFVEARGPESRQPLGVGAGEETLSGTMTWLALTAEQMQLLMGGSMAYSGGTGKTTYSKGINDEPSAFNMHVKTPENAEDMEVFLYNCLANDFTLLDGGVNREFNQFRSSWRCYGRISDGKLFDVILPGNQTGSS